MVTAPATTTFASLKADLTDAAGDSVHQTVIHVYDLRPKQWGGMIAVFYTASPEFSVLAVQGDPAPAPPANPAARPGAAHPEPMRFVIGTTRAPPS